MYRHLHVPLWFFSKLDEAKVGYLISILKMLVNNISNVIMVSGISVIHKKKSKLYSY